MKYEYNSYVTRGRGFISMKNEESSFTKDITPEKAEAFKDVLKELGYNERETSITFSYSRIINSNESEEYIFYKERG